MDRNCRDERRGEPAHPRPAWVGREGGTAVARSTRQLLCVGEVLSVDAEGLKGSSSSVAEKKKSVYDNSSETVIIAVLLVL